MRIVTYDEIKRLPVGTVFYRVNSYNGAADGSLDGPYRKDCESKSDLFQAFCGPRYCDRGYDQDRPVDDEGDLVELGLLVRLVPPGRRHHVRARCQHATGCPRRTRPAVGKV